VCIVNRLHLLVGESLFLFQVVVDHRLAQIELYILFDRASYFRPLDWGLSRLQVIVNVISCPVVDFLEPSPLLGYSVSERRLLFRLFQLPVDMRIAEIEPSG
jgi:hypothetical protein